MVLGGGSGIAFGAGSAVRNRHSTKPLGRAALGAINPDQPSLQSSSPISWKGSQVCRPGVGRGKPTSRRRFSVDRLATSASTCQVHKSTGSRWSGGKVPVPLGPGRLRFVGEVECIHQSAALPSVVGGRIAMGTWGQFQNGCTETSALGWRLPERRAARFKPLPDPRSPRRLARPAGTRLRRSDRGVWRRPAPRSACSAIPGCSPCS